MEKMVVFAAGKQASEMAKLGSFMTESTLHLSFQESLEVVSTIGVTFRE